MALFVSSTQLHNSSLFRICRITTTKSICCGICILKLGNMQHEHRVYSPDALTSISVLSILTSTAEVFV